MKGYSLVEALTGDQVRDAHLLLQTTWWARDRSLDDVAVALENSDLVLGIEEADSKRLVGFLRVLTDHVTVALVLDVVIAPDLRGAGLGRMLVSALLENASLARVNVELYCLPELVDFYSNFGFRVTSEGSVLLRYSRHSVGSNE